MQAQFYVKPPGTVFSLHRIFRLLVIWREYAVTCLAAHPAARFRTGPADIGAARHLGIVHSVAGSGASLAYDGASGAGGLVGCRVAGHEIRRCLADLNAIHHQPYMVWCKVMTALFQTVVEQRGLARIAARPALRNAIMQGRVGVIMHDELLVLLQ